ncbi:integrase [Sinorhizobium meliloti]|uniref:tyrosine-type recombinase/integrase n=1 Tax=Rhizobium meliloti TaxID=382 RepID=UPI000FDAB0CA|nr:tyrosine-type recombinase/integrase [Sinorhizobium meliloti]RVP13100.1 integrase [Sinorhizobium meliloti]
MRVPLKGIHKTSKKLADGTTKEYYYLGKGGPRIKAEYGTAEFLEEYRKLTNASKRVDPESFLSIIRLYERTELSRKAKATQRSYKPFVATIEKRFGTLPIEAIEEHGSRALFMEWREEMADRPRTADLAWSVLQRIMAFGLDKEKLKRNPCEKAGRLADEGTRREKVWTPTDIAKFKAKAPTQILEVFMMALWTGQRQGDLLRLTWSAYDGTHIRLEQSKTKARVTIKVADELKKILDAKRESLGEKDLAAVTILTTAKGKSWTSDGFRTSWGKALIKAKVSGLTFHDLRGTFITNARRAGASIEDIASASGHKISDVRSILEVHYLANDHEASDAVILKLERKGK